MNKTIVLLSKHITFSRIKLDEGRAQTKNGFFVVNVPEANQLGLGFKLEVKGIDYVCSVSS